tara:strand:- start:250 stop:609 length:360 start_codon:yes stop_codon:yes gene_type:complete
MRFLLDEDVYAATARLLGDLGHELVSAAETWGPGTNDEALLTKAQEQGLILLTRDRDFGGLVFLRRLAVGVIYIRILPSTQNAVHQELQTVLRSYSENDLMKAFVVVEPGRHRFRRLAE